jgi:hypothetical protein
MDVIQQVMDWVDERIVEAAGDQRAVLEDLLLFLESLKEDQLPITGDDYFDVNGT